MVNNRYWRWITPYTKISLIIMLFAFILSIFSPPAWAVENGPVEWLQVVVLLATCILVVFVYYFGVGTLANRRLLLWTIPLWLLVIGRELGWGREVVRALEVTQKLPDIWYKWFVYPAIVAVSAVTLGGLLRNGLLAEVRRWHRFGRVPVVDIIIIVGVSVMVELVEHHSRGFFGDREQVYEEFAELAVFIAVFILVANLGFNKEIQPVPSARLAEYGRRPGVSLPPYSLPSAQESKSSQRGTQTGQKT